MGLLLTPNLGFLPTLNQVIYLLQIHNQDFLLILNQDFLLILNQDFPLILNQDFPLTHNLVSQPIHNLVIYPPQIPNQDFQQTHKQIMDLPQIHNQDFQQTLNQIMDLQQIPNQDFQQTLNQDFQQTLNQDFQQTPNQIMDLHQVNLSQVLPTFQDQLPSTRTLVIYHLHQDICHHPEDNLPTIASFVAFILQMYQQLYGKYLDCFRYVVAII